MKPFASRRDARATSAANTHRGPSIKSFSPKTQPSERSNSPIFMNKSKPSQQTSSAPSRKRGLLSRRRRKDETSVGSTVVGDDSVSSGSTRVLLLSSSNHRCDKGTALSNSISVNVDDPRLQEPGALHSHLRALRLQHQPPSSSSRFEGPVDVDSVQVDDLEDEERREGPVSVDDFGPVDCDDFIASSSSESSLDISAYVSNPNLFADDDDFDRCLTGYLEGCEPEITNDATEMFPTIPETRTIHHPSQQLQQRPVERAAKKSFRPFKQSSSKSIKSSSTRAEC